jgi:TRAP-type C4-dicarboxylate transport system substrate-binding protein
MTFSGRTRVARVIVSAFAGLLTTAFGWPSSVRADEPVTLRFAYSGPPTSPYLLHAVAPWAEKVMKDSDGSLKIDIVPGARLASMGNTYDRLVAGVFDIGFSLQGVSPGKFPRSDIVEFPYLIRNATDGSRALWQLYERGLLGDEYAEVKPLALFVFSPDALHFRGQVRSEDELKGLKISSDAQMSGLYLSKLGAVPVSMTPNDLYTSMRQHLISGITEGWTGMTQYKLEEVTDSHIDIPFGAEPGYVLMNKQAYEKLPPKAKASIDKNSGLPFSLLWGKTLDAMAAQQHDFVAKLPGQTIVTLSPAEDARFEAVAKELRDEKIKDVPNGPALLAALEAELREAR